MLTGTPCAPDTPRELGAEWPQRDLTHLHSGAFVASCGHKLPALWLGSAPDQQESSACQLWSSLSQSKKWQERIQSHLVLVSLKEQFPYDKHRPEEEEIDGFRCPFLSPPSQAPTTHSLNLLLKLFPGIGWETQDLFLSES